MIRPYKPVIHLGPGHCCACSVVCHHIGGPFWCAKHSLPASMEERLLLLDRDLDDVWRRALEDFVSGGGI